MRSLIPVLFIFIMTACEDIKYLNTPATVYKIVSKETDNTEINILVNRLSEYSPSLFSKIVFVRDANELLFLNGSPDYEYIQYFSNHSGKFIIEGDSELDQWISNKHIFTATPAIHNDQISLKIVLTAEGAEILESRTRANKGRRIAVRLDDTIIMQGSIRDELSKYITISQIDKSYPEIIKISILLKYGNLNQPIMLEPII